MWNFVFLQCKLLKIEYNILSVALRFIDCIPHRRKLRSPKLAPKRTLPKSKIAEINITEIQIIDMKFDEMLIAEYLSVIYVCEIRFLSQGRS